MTTKHGTRRQYTLGCRCDLCRDTNRRYCKQHRLRRARGLVDLIDAEPVREHIGYLMARGMLVSSISQASGVSNTSIREILRGRERVSGPNAEALLAVEEVSSAGTAWLSSLGAVRRMRALHALGYTVRMIAAEIGSDRMNVGRIINGRHATVTATVHVATCAAYERLAMHLPEGRTQQERAGISRAKAKAQRFGWLPPLAWDDIDDPNEKPVRGDNDRHNGDVDRVVVERVMAGENLPTTRAEKDEIVRRWRALGWSLNELERRTGWKTDRYGREETAA